MMVVTDGLDRRVATSLMEAFSLLRPIEIVEMVAPTADNPFAVRHKLARNPIAFTWSSTHKDGVVWSERADRATWTRDQIVVRCGRAGATIQLCIFA